MSLHSLGGRCDRNRRGSSALEISAILGLLHNLGVVCLFSWFRLRVGPGRLVFSYRV